MICKNRNGVMLVKIFLKIFLQFFKIRVECPFKYDILTEHCCDWRSVGLVVYAFAFQPSQHGSIRALVTNAWNGSIQSINAVLRNGKENAWSNLFFCLKTLHYS